MFEAGIAIASRNRLRKLRILNVPRQRSMGSVG